MSSHIDGHLNYFQCFDKIKISMNILVHIIWWTQALIPAGYVASVFIIIIWHSMYVQLKKILPNGGCTNLYNKNNLRRYSIFYNFVYTWYCQVLKF